VRTLETPTPARAPARVLALGWAALWLLACCAWIARIGLEWYLSGSVLCMLEGSSFIGESSWSWLPPGQVCTWEVTAAGQSFTITEEPPTERLVVPVLLLLWGVSVATLGLRRPRRMN